MLKDKLKKKKLTIGSWITLAHPAIGEIMAKSGFDWLAVDMEHSAITLSEAQNLIQVIELCQVTPLVRVSDNDPTLIKRVMDAGAHGVIVPMVNTAADAKLAVSSVKYPPVGKRGVGLARAQGYGLEFEKYKNWVNKHSVVIVQIEHIEAVDNLDEILECPGVDGFIVGPYDLSASLGKPGNYEDSAVKDAINEIRRKSKKHSCVSGFHVIPPDHRQVIKKAKEGYLFIGFSLDTLFLGNNCRKGILEAKKGCRI
jgi:2-dehydro-3-deoxyglucarate aldolase